MKIYGNDNIRPFDRKAEGDAPSPCDTFEGEERRFANHEKFQCWTLSPAPSLALLLRMFVGRRCVRNCVTSFEWSADPPGQLYFELPAKLSCDSCHRPVDLSLDLRSERWLQREIDGQTRVITGEERNKLSQRKSSACVDMHSRLAKRALRLREARAQMI